MGLYTVFIWTCGYGIGISAFAEREGWIFRATIFAASALLAFAAGLVKPSRKE